MTDTVIKEQGMKALLSRLGKVEAERFVMLIQREAFDYTKWQENLFSTMTIDDIYTNATKYRVGTSG